MKDVKQLMKRYLKMFLLLILMGITGLALMAAAFLIPTGMIRNHVSQSIPMIMKDKERPFPVTEDIRGSKLDVLTDAMYLNEALVGTKDASLWACILSGYYFEHPVGNTSVEDNLSAVVNDPDAAGLSPACCRFFNGYEAVLKPLLVITDYSGIREINLLVSFFLFLLLCGLMMKKNLDRYIIPFIISLLFINPVSIAFCMTLAGFYYCMIIPCIVILSIDKKVLSEIDWIIFEVTGACAFYFNMNYFQLIAFGIPVIYYFMILGLPDKLKDLMKKIAFLFSAWFIGYAGMMVFKWVVYAITLDHQIFSQMFENIAFRTSSNQGSGLYGFLANAYTGLHNVWWDVIELLFIVFCIYRYKQQKTKTKIPRIEIIFLLTMFFVPFCRFLLFPNHVIIHNRFTYRILMITAFAFNALLAKWTVPVRSDKNRFNWSTVDGFILDVDGTLYSQKKVRWAMLWRLLAYYTRKPNKLKELAAIYYFRKLREKAEYKDKSMEELYKAVEEKVRLPYDDVSDTIQKWMFEEPLDLLKKHAYRNVIEFVNRQHEDGKRIIIYSDYPAESKLNAMGISFDKVFVSGQEGFNELKPSLTAMQIILSDSELSADKLIYVGDRDDKDKASADMVGLLYFDITEFAKMV